VNRPPEPGRSPNVQLDAVGRDPEAAEPDGEAVRRVGRKLYLPTIAITGLAAWVSWRGWSALADTGVARSFDDGRYQLAGPAVLGFVLVVGVLLARTAGIFGFRLTFSSAEAYTVLVVEVAAVVLLSVTAWPQLNQRR
jgi:hypothetical protein